MVKIAVVGCTGKLGRAIINTVLHRADTQIRYAIARKGNPYVGSKISDLPGIDFKLTGLASGLTGSASDLTVVDDIESAIDCDVFIDCTSAEAFMGNNYAKYEKMGKPLVIATTAFSDSDMEKIRELSAKIPVFLSGNFSLALYNFLETLKFAAARISPDTDVQIIEYHHNQKKDAPSGTAIMIKNALLGANKRLKDKDIDICSVRGGSIFGEHEVIFANCKDEVMTFKHAVSSRAPFADGAAEVMMWTAAQPAGLYGMDDFCGEK